MMGRRERLLLCCLVIALVAIIPVSQAAFPGKNGLIYYTSAPPISHGDQSGGSGIWVMNANGSHRHSLIPGSAPHSYSSPAISPNGRKVAYFDDSSDRFSLWLMNPNGSGKHLLTRRTDAPCASFTPNGRKVVFISGNSVAEINTNGSHLHRLIYGATCPSVSPSGEIAFIKSVFFGRTHEGSEIIVTRANGSHHRVALRTREHDFDPTFSPNGRKIIFTGNSPDTNIFTISARGSRPHQLTHHPGLAECPAFSPDGHKIVYVQKTRARPRREQIWVMNANGSHQHRLTHSKTADYCPQWAQR